MLTQMFHPWVPMFDNGTVGSTDYGYGWQIAPHGSEYSHSGGLPGFVSLNVLLPRTQTVLIVLSNLDSTRLNDIAQYLGNIADQAI